MNYILVSRGDDYSNKVKLDLINHLNKFGFINIEDKISKNNTPNKNPTAAGIQAISPCSSAISIEGFPITS